MVNVNNFPINPHDIEETTTLVEDAIYAVTGPFTLTPVDISGKGKLKSIQISIKNLEDKHKFKLKIEIDGSTVLYRTVGNLFYMYSASGAAPLGVPAKPIMFYEFDETNHYFSFCFNEELAFNSSLKVTLECTEDTGCVVSYIITVHKKVVS